MKDKRPSSHPQIYGLFVVGYLPIILWQFDMWLRDLAPVNLRAGKIQLNLNQVEPFEVLTNALPRVL